MNIVLLDRPNLFIDSLLNHTDWHVSLLITEGRKYKKRYNGNARIAKIYMSEDIVLYKEYVDLDESILNYCKDVFLESDYAARRTMNNIAFSHYMFYMGISFWHSFFKQNRIDAVITTGLIHGYPFDVLLCKVARYHKVPLFQFSYEGYEGINFLFNGQLLPVYQNGSNNDYHTIEERVRGSAFYAKYYKDDIGKAFEENTIRHKILRLIYNSFGVKGIDMAGILWSFVQSGYHLKKNYADIGLANLLGAHYRYKKYVRSMRRMYQPVDLAQKYVIFFLHFEPEATLTHYADIFLSQLVIIQMLAEQMPNGWKLIVKEHPDFYKLNEWEFNYFLPNVPTFQTSYWVENLIRNPNVVLCDYKIPASQLIDNAQAVATIVGTVILESVLKYKNVLVFADYRRTVYAKCNDIFMIDSTEKLRIAMTKIEQGYVPKYDNFFDIYDRYTFSRLEEAGWKQAIALIDEKLGGDNGVL